jgi:nicotinamide-nucleotide amidase
MVAELISVGTELLLGNIVNTNAQYLSKRLAALGIDVHYQTVVGDNSGRIKNTLDVAFSRGDTVILTGGLGPTKDDMTKEMLISYFHKKPVLDENALAALTARLKKLDVAMTDHHRKQAIVPDDSIVLINHNGTAPGVIMEDGGRTAILLPGPPKEMKPMFEEYVADYLAKRSGRVFVSVNIKMLDFDHAPVRIVGEAPVADRLDPVIDQANPTVATYAKDDGCLIRVTASAPTKEAARELLKPTVETCCELLGRQYINYIKEDED